VNCKFVGACVDARCGDGTCTAGANESSRTCAEDCGSVCGDGAVNGREQCDGTTGVGVCPDGTSGTVTCNPTDCTRDTSGCRANPRCGNGVIETGEECDGTVGVGSCAPLAGTVTCNQCKLDTSGCHAPNCLEPGGGCPAGQTCNPVTAACEAPVPPPDPSNGGPGNGNGGPGNGNGGPGNGNGGPGNGNGAPGNGGAGAPGGADEQ
jgi:hypothetical protein